MAQVARRTLDVAMAALVPFLMGGSGLFENRAVHEILGVLLFALWAVHLWWNRAWIKALPRGRWRAARIVRTAVNGGAALCALLLAVSGVMLSNVLFAWMGIESGMAFARSAHMLASHWFLVFVSLHVGLHLGTVLRGKLATGIGLALAGYGIYAFVERGIWKYMTLRQPFFFLDLGRGGLPLFLLDCLAVMALFAAAARFALAGNR